MDYAKLAIFFGLLAILTFLAWYVGFRRSDRNAEALPTDAVVLIQTTSGDISVPVELARNSAEKVQGLSDRESLPKDSGMFFVWDLNVPTSFSMRRMKFPLDIIFIRGVAANEGVISSIAADLPACPGKTVGCPTATAKEAIQYVLEVNGGYAAERGIEAGDKVSIVFSQ